MGPSLITEINYGNTRGKKCHLPTCRRVLDISWLISFDFLIHTYYKQITDISVLLS